MYTDYKSLNVRRFLVLSFHVCNMVLIVLYRRMPHLIKVSQPK